MKLAVLSDLLEERWPSMDLITEMLVRHASSLPGVAAINLRPALPRRLSRLAMGEGARRFSRAASLALARYVVYPLELPAIRGRFDYFHVADHSYAHLALGLPRERTGVYCHDIDAFRPLFSASAAWRRALARTLLAGLRRASVVFYSTETVRDEILEHALVPAERLVGAPYGTADEFQPNERAEDAAIRRAAPYLLHVGSLIPRKNPEFLLRVFARARRTLPSLMLIQVGGSWDDGQRAFLEREGLAGAVAQLRGISRDELAAYYRSAAAVLLPSTAEGFGLPIIEALACGAPVVLSDIRVLRQVGGNAALYCPPSNLETWHDSVVDVVRGGGPDRSTRLREAARYSWQTHATTIASAYAALRAAN